MPRIILASGSPRRKNLLTQIGLTFEVIPSSISEETYETEPAGIVENLAEKKAADVAKDKTNSTIIGADTIVVFENEVLGKPQNEKEAEEMLLKLSGTFHEVFTGVALIQTDEQGVITKKNVFHEQTKVYFSALEQQEIQRYIKTGSPFDKAGAYGIQDDLGAIFIKRIEGDYYNVVGLPLNRFYNEWKTFSPNLSF